MKKFRRILALAVLLAVSLLTLAIADEKSQILIDSARNAAIKVKTSESAGDVSGSFNVSGEVAKGLVAGSMDLKFSPDVAKQVGDLQGAIYYTMTDVMEIVGNLDMPVPPEAGKELSKLNANLESVTSESKAYAKGDLNLEAKAQDKVPTVNLDMTAKGSGKSFDGKVTFDVDAGEDLGQVPFKSFDFGISETDTSTTISFGASLDAASPQAQQMKMMGQNPDQVKQGITSQLGSAGITVEKVEIGEYKEENGAASAKLAITLKGWREKIKSTVPAMAGGGQFDSQKLTESVSQMLEAKFDSVTFTIKVEGKSVKGDITGKISNMKQLALGYYQLASMIAEAQLKDQGGSDDPGQRMLLAYQTVAMEEAQKAIQAAVDSDMGFDLKGKLKISGEGEDKKLAKVTGDFSSDFSNYAAYIAKAQAANLPTPKNAALKFVMGMSGQGRLTGSLFAYSDVNVINYYKKMLLATAKKGGAPDDALAMAEKVEFKASEGSISLNKDGVKGSNYLESNDLSPVFKAILAAASEGKFQGDLTGFSVAGKSEGEKMNIDVMVNFAKFMEGKSADEVKQALSAPSSATVKEGASAEEVKLVAVTKPEVAMPESLKSVAADGKKLIETSPLAGVTGALGGKGGGSSMLYILGGLAAVGVVGVGVIAGRKKS